MPKEEKSTVKVVDSLFSDAMENVEKLTSRAKDACDLEDVLLNTIKSIYESLPDGKRLYGGEQPIGRIKLSSPTTEIPEIEGIIAIDFNPSNMNYYECEIAEINLRNKTYRVCPHHIPLKLPHRQQFIADTEKVMEYLGLRKVKARNI